MENKTIQFNCTFNASAADVYRAFTNATFLREWFCEMATTEPKPDGRIYFWWRRGYYAAGYYTTLRPEKEIGFAWQGASDPAITSVKVLLEAIEGGVKVALEHSGFGDDVKWTDPYQAAQAGWQFGLENLASVLETGKDLRITRRPMIGIIGGENLTAPQAEQLGLPVSGGFRLNELVEGMGAQASGMQKGDVIVELDGKKLASGDDLVNIVGLHYAGAVLPVVFYRGQERKSAGLKLSARPQPEIPTTAAGMAGVLTPIYTRNLVELEKCLEGKSEAELNRRPAAGEWSACEILAHLLQSEHGFQARLFDMISGEESWYDGFAGNPAAIIAGILAIYPTRADLMAELRRAQEVTVATLAALPPEFMARKGTWWRLATTLPYTGLHVEEHLRQMPPKGFTSI